MENFSLVKKLINNFINVLQNVPNIIDEKKYQYAIVVSKSS